MEFILQIVDIFLHLDVHLNSLAATMGPWLYVLLFVIVFCETGLVVTPFLPGDSLLFAVGALSAIEGSPINLVLVIILLIIAAVLGDFVNFEIGKYIGPKVFKSETSKWLNKDHLMKAHNFYEKYGGKTIILARFIPIIRTFAPFVAGAGKMTYRHFAAYNVIGAVIWVVLFSLAGFFFADLPVVKNHFHYVIVAIIVISVLPAVYEFIAAKRKGKKA
ncbi:membrane-associated protein [Elusimicrobium posterum]|uniref:DedA family protein n=1 Tax=Elusimicrobium posterum TaxID=3116653 RepID=UPI003C71A399